MSESGGEAINNFYAKELKSLSINTRADTLHINSWTNPSHSPICNLISRIFIAQTSQTRSIRIVEHITAIDTYDW
ncbi:hypothetical protein I312_102794 [Cryptococcus bacillisporus CA1280]|uniref:uncharacterized protein n=1 Tax=Cryptococcus bacillisporus CA1280 TaxID=1296109 RepID=UPI00336769B3